MRPRTRAIPVRMGGFTLIEVMVVVVIIAALSSMVVINAMPGDAAQVDREARRLAALLELASAEARAGGQSIAWSQESDGYSFWQRSDDGEWTRFSDASVYRRRSFLGRAGFREVRLDARVLPQGDLVTLSAYGTRGLIEATIGSGNARITLRGDVLGRIWLQRDSDESDGRAADGRPVAGTRLHPG